MVGFKIYLCFLVIFVSCIYDLYAAKDKQYQMEDINNNDEADFDEFDDDFEDETLPEKPAIVIDEAVVTVADNVASDVPVKVEEADEFANLVDEEEFEGFDSAVKHTKEKKPKLDTLAFADLPIEVKFVYYLESVLVCGIIIYFLNYLIGRSRNADIVASWFDINSSTLVDNFALVGDDNEVTVQDPNYISKESDHIYTLWCSGRTCCEGMLVELRLIKRQDLLSFCWARFVHKKYDQIDIKIPLSKDDMDNYVFCVASKHVSLSLSKDQVDLNTFCPERKTADKYGIPSNFVIMSEFAEVSTSFFDPRTVSAFNRFADYIDYVHISDRYAGPKPSENEAQPSPDKPLEHKRMLLVSYSLIGPSNDDVIEYTQPLLPLIFYWLEKVKRFRLGKEAKAKSDKNRLRVDESVLKTANAARSEAAAVRREEKKRKEKEQILMEDDPEKQRRWEEREIKRQMKKKIPRMKQLKVKSL